MIRLGSRSSPLAIKQAELVVNAIRNKNPDVEIEIIPIKTKGDKITTPLYDSGGKALFTKELQESLLDGTIHGAVHSLKDVECHQLPLVFAAFLEREDPYDILITNNELAFNKEGESIRLGTCAPRRMAQVALAFPKIDCVPLRGNVETRLQHVEDGFVDATILANAGLKRLGYDDKASLQKKFSSLIMLPLDPFYFVPAAGQGIIAVECLPCHEHLFESINHYPTQCAALIERKLVSLLNGDCKTAIGAHYKFCDSDNCYILHGFYEGQYFSSHHGPIIDEINEEKLQKQAAFLLSKNI